MKFARSATKAKSGGHGHITRSPLGLVHNRNEILKHGNNKFGKKPFDLTFRVKQLLLYDILQASPLQIHPEKSKESAAEQLILNSVIPETPNAAGLLQQDAPSKDHHVQGSSTAPEALNPQAPAPDADLAEMPKQGGDSEAWVGENAIEEEAGVPIEEQSQQQQGQLSAEEIAEMLCSAREARQELTRSKFGREYSLQRGGILLQLNQFLQVPSWQVHLQEILEEIAQAHRIRRQLQMAKLAKTEQMTQQANADQPPAECGVEVPANPAPELSGNLHTSQEVAENVTVGGKDERGSWEHTPCARASPKTSHKHSAKASTAHSRRSSAFRHSAEPSPIEGVLERKWMHQQQGVSPRGMTHQTPVEGILEREWAGMSSSRPRQSLRPITPKLSELPSDYREEEEWSPYKGSPVLRGLDCAPEVPMPPAESQPRSPPGVRPESSSKGGQGSDLDNHGGLLGGSPAGFEDAGGAMSEDVHEAVQFHEFGGADDDDVDMGLEFNDADSHGSPLGVTPSPVSNTPSSKAPAESSDKLIQTCTPAVLRSDADHQAVDGGDAETTEHDSTIQMNQIHPAGEEGNSAKEAVSKAPKDEKRSQRRKTEINLRLKNMYRQRKSLAGDGMQSTGGKRRSTRQRHRPLEWWRQETKIYSREHRSLPTVDHVVTHTPDSFWKTVSGGVTRKSRLGRK